MVRYRQKVVTVLAVIPLLLSAAGLSEETWHLQQDGDWKLVSDEKSDEYLLAVAEIKKLVDAGKTDAVQRQFECLKRDYPEISGPDMDAFIEAEILFSQAKLAGAARAYDKILTEYPQSRFYDAALDRQFAIATAFLGGQKKPVLKIFKIRGYAEGEKIMQRITDRAGDTPIGIKAAVAVAESYEKRGKFEQAYQQWSQISSRWPTGQIGNRALLAMARCKHAAYKGPKYDASDLISAKSYYENCKLRYPEDAKKFDIDKKLEQIDEQLAYKQFSIGQYYQQTGNLQSANLYYQMVVDNWPNSTAAKMAKEMIGKGLSSEKVKK